MRSHSKSLFSQTSLFYNHFLKSFTITFIILFTSLTCSAQASSTLSEAWNAASKLLFDESFYKFEKAVKEHAQEPELLRESRYGLAVALLNKQPKTERNLDEAAGLLRSVRNANSSDNFGVSSLFFLARIEESHRSKLSEEKAKALYQELFKTHPTHPMGQMAYVKFGQISLYEVKPLAEKTQQILTYEKQGAFLTDLDAKRSFHSLLANTYTLLKIKPDNTLTHLLSLEKMGVMGVEFRKDILVRIAETYRIQNNIPQAIIYYEKFLAAYAWDSRRYTIEKKLATLKGAKS